MHKTVYEDYKYCIQDTGRLYVGCKYTFRELLEEEEILFKFRLVMRQHIMPEADLEDTLESHLYYLDPESFLVRIYRQMKAKVRVNVLEEKKSGFRKAPGAARKYVTKQFTVEELAGVSPAEKERQGYVIQELSVSKLALAAL